MPQNYTSIDDILKKNKNIPISTPKESEPMPSGQEIELKEAVEHKPEDEVRPFVTPSPETIELPPDLKKMGLQAASVTKFPSFQNVKTPLSDDKIVLGLHAPVTTSIRWLATLAVYLLQKAHLSLKIVHGRVVRILQT